MVYSVRGKAQSDFCYQEGRAKQYTSCQSLGEADPCPVRHLQNLMGSQRMWSSFGPGTQGRKIYTHSTFFSFRFETKRAKFHIEKNI